MKEQNYKNHRKFVIPYHVILFSFVCFTVVFSVFHLINAVLNDGEVWFAVSYFIISIILMFSVIYMRLFALKAQDRAILVEQNLRYYTLTGKLMDTRLTLKQIIALRFASDNELVSLTEKTLAENLTPDSIKKQIKNWRPDLHRL